jgi:PAS domain S-box-containing protein
MLLALIGVGIATMVATSTAFYVLQRNVAQANADRRLVGMAMMGREILPPGYHDRITGPDSVSEQEFAAIVDRNNRTCQALGLQCLWDLMEFDGRIVFTSVTSSDGDTQNGRHARFFAPPTNPEVFTNAFATMRTTHQTIDNPRGRFRVAFVPWRDGRGRKHVAAAGMGLAGLHQRVRSVTQRAVLVGLVAFVASLVAGLSSTRRIVQPLRRLANVIQRTAAGERGLVADEHGTQELSTLARQVNRLNRAQQETITGLKTEGEQLAQARDEERKRAATDLQSRETLYRELVNLAVDGILLGAPDGTILDANEYACALFGLPRDQIVGKGIRELPFDPQSGHAKPFRFDLLEQGHTVVTERSILRPDGSSVVVEMRSKKMPDGTLQSIYRDVTERTKAHELLESWNAALEQRVAERTAEVEQYSRKLRALADRITTIEEEERRRIVDVLHEDLQQVLVAARMALGTVPASPTGATGRQPMERIDDMLTRALELSRTLVQQIALPSSEEGSLCTAISLLACQMQEKFGLQVQVTCAPELVVPERHAYVALYRAIQELLFNVVKHAGVLQANVAMQRQPDGAILVTVSDQGRGFPIGQMQDAASGAGRLGLFGIRERLEGLGGRVDIASAAGAGTTVCLTIPARAASATAS